MIPFAEPMRSISGKGLLAIVFWGTSFVATRIALESFHPVGLVAIRLGAGTVLLFLLLGLRGERAVPPRRDRPAILVLGALLGIHLLLQSFGLLFTTAINTGWIIGFNPVLIALGAHLLGQQRLAGTGWLGVALGTAGLFFVTLDRPPGFEQARLGDLLQILSCFTWTASTLVAVGSVRRLGAMTVTAVSGVVATVVTTAAALTTGFVVRPPGVESLGALVFLGLVCSGYAYYLWFAAVDEHGPARVGALLYLEPLVTLVAAMTVLAEPFTARAAAGGVAVLLGVRLVTRESRRSQ